MCILFVFVPDARYVRSIHMTERSGMQSSGYDGTQDPATLDISEVYLPSFSTFSETALTMFRAMFGDFDFDEFSSVRCVFVIVSVHVCV